MLYFVDVYSMNTDKNNELTLWAGFAARHALTEKQLSQFQEYYRMVCSSNELFNLTAITQLNTFLTHHLDDALALGAALDMNSVKTMADIGTGAGVPAIPLKIKYPHLVMTLIEVSHKKIQFLQEVADILDLDDVFTCDYDWRTFLRKIDEPLELFCARASLQPEELVRIFKPSSPYRQSTLVYWASSHWEPSGEVKPYIKQDVAYKVAHKKRRLIFLRV